MITIWGERIAAVLSSVIAICIMYKGWDFPANGNIFPIFLSFAVIGISILMVIRTITSPAVFDGLQARFALWEDAKPILLTAGVVFYVLMIFQIGYYTSSALFLCLAAFSVGVRSVKTIGLTVIIAFPLMWLFFELFLHADMPRGILL